MTWILQIGECEHGGRVIDINSGANENLKSHIEPSALVYKQVTHTAVTIVLLLTLVNSFEPINSCESHERN